MNVSTLSSRWLAIALSSAVLLSGVVAGPTSRAMAGPTLETFIPRQPVIAGLAFGHAKVGMTVVVDVGIWDPEPTSFEYQWFSENKAIRGATAKSFAITTPNDSEDEGLYVRVTAKRKGFANAAISSNHEQVVAAEINLGEITIRGDATVGSRWVMPVGPVSPFFVTKRYQWLRDGVEIPRANASTYYTSVLDIGSRLQLRVTGSAEGFTTVAVESASTDVVRPKYAFVPVPSITGTPQVGGTVTAHPDPSSPAGARFTFLWFSDGHSVGQTGADHVIDGSEVGTALTAITKMSSDERGPTNSEPSEPTALVVPGVLTPGSITIKSKRKVGEEVYITHFKPGSPALTTNDYQWLRNGKPIAGATTGLRMLTQADYNKVLSLKVTRSSPGYIAASVTSNRVRIGTGRMSIDYATMSPAPRVGSTSTIEPGDHWGPGKVKFAYQWVIRDKDGHSKEGSRKRSHAFTSKDLGKEVWAHVEGSAKGLTGGFNDSVHYTVRKGVFSKHPAPTIYGSKTVGSTLTAGRGKWSPSSATTFTYKWFSQTEAGAKRVAISGATGAKYTITRGQRGHLISVRVTASKKVYVTKSSMSAATPEIKAKK